MRWGHAWSVIGTTRGSREGKGTNGVREVKREKENLMGQQKYLGIKNRSIQLSFREK